MSKVTFCIGRTVFLCTLAALALAVPERSGRAHDAGHFSAGEPGDPKKKSRVILVTMKEGEGKMMFIPDRVEIRRDEQIRFILTNTGLLPHEFILASTEENLKHAEEMKKNPEMEHDDPNGKRVEPGKKSEIVWKFTKAGTFEYGCLIPGHREAGMTGIITVK
jgi:uncharacterized cupredoxin-like copper-binding protein